MPREIDPGSGLPVWGATAALADRREGIRRQLASLAGRVETIEDSLEVEEVVDEEAADASDLEALTERVTDLEENRQHPSDEIDLRIAGLTANDSTKLVYSVQDHSTPAYIRSTTCWAADLDLTCVSPWNSSHLHLAGGTAITPRHCAFANHAHPDVGATLRFVTASNQIVARVLTSGMRVGTTDIWIGLLESNLPSTITPARVLPDNWSLYLRAQAPDQATRMACALFDQEEKIVTGELTSITDDDPAVVSLTNPLNAQRLAFFETPILNDSANPVLIFVNGITVLLCCLTGSGSGASLIGDNRAGVLSAITTLGAFGHTLTDVVLSPPSIDWAAVRNAPSTFVLPLTVGDETTDLTTGTAKLTFRMPFAMTLTAVRLSVNTAPAGSSIIVDVNKFLVGSLLSTRPAIDAGERTSVTGTAAVISTSTLSDDDEITIDIDQVGSVTAGKGLKVTLIGNHP